MSVYAAEPPVHPLSFRRRCATLSKQILVDLNTGILDVCYSPGVIIPIVQMAPITKGFYRTAQHLEKSFGATLGGK